MPEIKEEFATVNASAESSTPAAFAAIAKTEYAQWAERIAGRGSRRVVQGQQPHTLLRRSCGACGDPEFGVALGPVMNFSGI